MLGQRAGEESEEIVNESETRKREVSALGVRGVQVLPKKPISGDDLLLAEKRAFGSDSLLVSVRVTELGALAFWQYVECRDAGHAMLLYRKPNVSAHRWRPTGIARIVDRRCWVDIRCSAWFDDFFLCLPRLHLVEAAQPILDGGECLRVILVADALS